MEWHDRDTIDVENIVQRTCRRYACTDLAGVCVEFTIMVRPDGSKVIASDAYDSFEDKCLLLMAANLMIGGFAGVEVIRANLAPPLSVPIRRVGW